MRTISRSLALVLIAAATLIGCNREKGYETAEPSTFAFVVYPGARYLAPTTDLFKRAHKLIQPNEEPPATAVYDTDASVEDVATYYAKTYGYGPVAADATNNLSAAKPPAYFRTGDLGGDAKSTEPIMKQLMPNVDVSKATGSYKAAEIEAKPTRPHVTIQRPYFDPATSQVVNRTLILMSRQ